MAYEWDFSVIWRSRGVLLDGLLTSLELTGFCILVGTFLAVPLALAMSRPAGVVRSCATFFVEVIRALPILVTLVTAYYIFPGLLGISLSAFWTAAWVLAIDLSAFAAGTLRGGIAAIPEEHIQAGEALGMTRWVVLRRITIPETIRRSIPGLTAQYITMFKFSTLASVISVRELLHTADSIITNSYRPLEVYVAVAVIYLAVIMPVTYLARWIEKQPMFALAPGKSG